MNALPLATSARPGSDFQDLLAERRDLEARLAACLESKLSAANRLDQVYEDLGRANVAPAIADEIYRIKTALRARHGGNGR